MGVRPPPRVAKPRGVHGEGGYGSARACYLLHFPFFLFFFWFFLGFFSLFLYILYMYLYIYKLYITDRASARPAAPTRASRRKHGWTARQGRPNQLARPFITPSCMPGTTRISALQRYSAQLKWLIGLQSFLIGLNTNVTMVKLVDWVVTWQSWWTWMVDWVVAYEKRIEIGWLIWLIWLWKG